MVKITFEIKDEMDQKFRKLIVQRKGFYRGAIQDSIIEAINLWMKDSKLSSRKSTKKKSLSSSHVPVNDELDKNQ